MPQEISTVTIATGVAVAATAGLAGYLFGRCSAPGKRRAKTDRGDNEINQYVMDHSLRQTEYQKELVEKTMRSSHSKMLSSRDEAQFLGNLVKAIGARKTLDIGVFTGYSALTVAMALPKDGRVVACDVTDKNLHKDVLIKAGIFDKIDLRIAPAMDTLNELLNDGEAETFDFAFIDADKENYWNYYELCLQLVRKNGIIAVDNTLWHGDVVFHPNRNSDTVAIGDFNKKVFNDSRVDISMLQLGDGTTLLFKR